MMGRVMGWVFTALALAEAAIAVARMLDGEDATANVACMIACGAMSGVYSIREEMER